MELKFLGKEQIEFLREGTYIKDDETPQQRFGEIVEKVREYESQYSEGLADRIERLIDENILSLSTPSIANFGRKKKEGQNSLPLPASCNIVTVGDSISDIYYSIAEVAMLSKLGAGVGSDFQLVSQKDTKLAEGFYSNSKLDWIEDSVRTAQKVSQQSVRRGYNTPFISIDDNDFDGLMKRVDKTNPDKKDPLINNTVGIILPKDFDDRVKVDKELQRRYLHVLKVRQKTGKAYIFHTKNANKNSSPVYKELGLDVATTNICCVSYDTKILTDKGYITIGDNVDSKFNVWNGEEFSEVLFQKTGENDELYRIKLDSGETLDCTPNHNFYVQENYSKNSLIKKPTTDLNVGDKLEKFELPIIEGYKFLNHAYTQGFYCGDGYGSDEIGNKSLIKLYGEKKNLVEHLSSRKKMINNGSERGVLTTEDHVKECNDGTINVFVPQDMELSKSFVPDASYRIEDRLEWFAGLLDSDGTVTKNKQNSETFQIASINKPFLNNVQLMLQTLGVHSTIRKGRSAGKYFLPANDGSNTNKEYDCKDVHRILISSVGLYQLKNLGLKTYRLKWDGNKPSRDARYFSKVASIEKLEGKHDSYCFYEPNRGRGMFNGMLTGQSEFLQPLFTDMTSVCVIGALNLTHWDIISKDPQIIKDSFMFLDIMNGEYVKLSEGIPFLEKAHKAAKEKRDIGLGVLGFAELLQMKGYAFGDIGSRRINREVFSTIRKYGEEITKEMGEKLGSPEICKKAGMVRRNASLIMVAPNKSTSFISNVTSGGIEPFMSNVFFKSLAKIQHVFKNKHLVKLLEEKGKNTTMVWDSIIDNNGSVLHLDFLSDDEKNVFRTFAEISPKDIIDLAGDRQEFIDMGQSLNLVFRKNYTLEDVYEIHRYAWSRDIKTLYYGYPSAHAALEKNGEKWDTCVSCAD